MKTVSVPCHIGVVNEACGFVGRSHPSHSFIAPHHTVYIVTVGFRVNWDEIVADERGSMFAR